MKIRVSQLRKIIKEEVGRVLSEAGKPQYRFLLKSNGDVEASPESYSGTFEAEKAARKFADVLGLSRGSYQFAVVLDDPATAAMSPADQWSQHEKNIVRNRAAVAARIGFEGEDAPWARRGT